MSKNEVPEPLVSICMPVYNGQALLPYALASLLAQDYRNLELIVLDNISTDRTRDICQQYAKKDSRLRYILDTSRVDVVGGHKRAAQYARGDFIMVACDDDIYDSRYISTLMTIMQQHADVGLVYSGFDFVDEGGNAHPAHMPKHCFLSAQNSKLYNFCLYLLRRRPVPMAFGLIRSDLHHLALEYYYRPDHRGWDHDNLYMLRLLSLTKVASTKELLFHYRQRDRSSTIPEDLPQRWISRFLYRAKHQASVAREVLKIIAQGPFTWIEKACLGCFNVIVLVYYASVNPLHSWLRHRLINSHLSQ